MHPALLLIGNGNDEAVGLSALIASATLLHHRNLPRLRGGNAIEAFAARHRAAGATKWPQN